VNELRDELFRFKPARVSFAYVRKAVWVGVISLSLDFSAYGQRLSFGVVGGTNLTSSFPGTDFTSPAEFGNPRTRYQYFTGPRTFITGALLEGHFTQRFSMEASALHRPMKTIVISTELPNDGTHKVFTGQFTGVRTWEFLCCSNTRCLSCTSEGARVHLLR
jgi:hypothetical protein